MGDKLYVAIKCDRYEAVQPSTQNQFNQSILMRSALLYPTSSFTKRCVPVVGRKFINARTTILLKHPGNSHVASEFSAHDEGFRARHGRSG